VSQGYQVKKLRFVWVLLLLPLLLGCSGQIVSPSVPEHPRAIFVLDHGRHSSLVLSKPDGSLVRYSYGDWHYYAEGETGLVQGTRALFFQTQGALGRRLLPGPAEEDAVFRQVRVGIVNLLHFQVEGAAVDRLDRELDALYQRNIHSYLYRAENDLEFVHHPQPYTLCHNSNQVVAEWLQNLGLEVHGRPVLSRWRLLKQTGQ
jgi:hypothetical protein